MGFFGHLSDNIAGPYRRIAQFAGDHMLLAGSIVLGLGILGALTVGLPLTLAIGAFLAAVPALGAIAGDFVGLVISWIKHTEPRWAAMDRLARYFGVAAFTAAIAALAIGGGLTLLGGSVAATAEGGSAVGTVSKLAGTAAGMAAGQVEMNSQQGKDATDDILPAMLFEPFMYTLNAADIVEQEASKVSKPSPGHGLTGALERSSEPPASATGR